MTIIDALRSYLYGYSDLKSGAPVWVNHLDAIPTSYSVVPLPGAKVIDEDLAGNKTCEYPFAFQSMESTADDLARLENIGFYEAFSEWLDAQTEAGSLPVLADGKEAEAIEATTWGYLFEQGQSQTGIYQINCKLTYWQQS